MENNEEFYKKFKESLTKHYTIANEISETFSQFIWKNPKQALDELFNWYELSLDKAYTNKKTGENFRCFVEMVAGGPHEAIPSAFYNCIGSIYPVLDRPTKDYALRKILNILDVIRNDYVQISHTSYICEPRLLSDITIVRPLYWPGLEDGKRIIKNYKIFHDFKFENINENGFFCKEKINSDFIMAYSLLRSDFCNWGQEYLEVVNNSFLERTLEGIVAMRFAFPLRLLNLSEKEKESIKEFYDYDVIQNKLKNKVSLEINDRRNRLKQLLPKSLHNKIELVIKNQDNWVDTLQFASHPHYLLKQGIEKFLED